MCFLDYSAATDPRLGHVDEICDCKEILILESIPWPPYQCFTTLQGVPIPALEIHVVKDCATEPCFASVCPLFLLWISKTITFAQIKLIHFEKPKQTDVPKLLKILIQVSF